MVLVAEMGLSRSSDEEILKIAQEQNRILITRDRDYGNLVFVKAIGTGVNTARLRIFRFDFRNVETRNFASLHSFSPDV